MSAGIIPSSFSSQLRYGFGKQRTFNFFTQVLAFTARPRHYRLITEFRAQRYNTRLYIICISSVWWSANLSQSRTRSGPLIDFIWPQLPSLVVGHPIRSQKWAREATRTGLSLPVNSAIQHPPFSATGVSRNTMVNEFFISNQHC